MNTAKPIINLIKTQADTSIENLHDNEEVIWNFKVTNCNEDNSINQVLLSYDMQIVIGTTFNDSIEYHLFKKGENGSATEIELINGKTNEGFTMCANTLQEDNYYLKLKTKNGVDIKGIEDNITIKLNAIQQISSN